MKSPCGSRQCCKRCWKCSSQRGPGKNFPEFFEKSIDKQKIDAILNSAVRFYGVAFVVAAEGGERRMFEAFGSHPDTRNRYFTAGNGVYILYMLGNGPGIFSPVRW